MDSFFLFSFFENLQQDKLKKYYEIWLDYESSVARWLSGKESACRAGEASFIPGSGRSPGEGNGNPLQYS